MHDLIEGRVIDELGNPVAGAYVSLTSEEESVRDIASITGREGKFRLTLPGGDFCVTVTTKSGLHGILKISKCSKNRFSPTIKLHH